MFHHRHLAAMICLSIWAALGSVSLVRADGLTIAVTEVGGATIEILDNGPLDSDPSEGSITVIAEALNPILMNFNFSSLRLTSNSSEVGASPVLKVSGTVVRVTTTGQKSRILIQGTDAAFADQTVTRLRTTATEIFLNAHGGDQLMDRSFLDPLNRWFGKGVPGPSVKGAPPAGHSRDIPAALAQGSNAVRLPLLGSLYSITNEIELSLGVSTPDNPRTVDFVGVTSASNTLSGVRRLTELERPSTPAGMRPRSEPRSSSPVEWLPFQPPWTVLRLWLPDFQCAQVRSTAGEAVVHGRN